MAATWRNWIVTACAIACRVAARLGGSYDDSFTIFKVRVAAITGLLVQGPTQANARTPHPGPLTPANSDSKQPRNSARAAVGAGAW